MLRPTTPDETCDYYLEEGRVVFTAGYLLRRGTCCGSGCRHCPYREAPVPSPTATVRDGITNGTNRGPRGGSAAEIL